MEQLKALRDYLEQLAPGGLCVAFSGGVDSAVLLKAACMAGGRVHAVTAYTLFHSPLEAREAEEMALSYGAVFRLLTPSLPQEVLDNPPDRCYLCKHALFSSLLDHARQNGLATVLDGTNADDLAQYRPGLRALKELGVRSPLAELGFDKTQVRRLAGELELEVASKPSAPCLATRYSYGHTIDPAALPALDALEQTVRRLGIQVVRARVEAENLVRLEVEPDRFGLVLEHREELVRQAVEAGFTGLSLDLEGFRSGSMDIRQKRLQRHKTLQQNIG